MLIEFHEKWSRQKARKTKEENSETSMEGGEDESKGENPSRVEIAWKKVSFLVKSLFVNR